MSINPFAVLNQQIGTLAKGFLIVSGKLVVKYISNE
jgi:hypothetical protein